MNPQTQEWPISQPELQPEVIANQPELNRENFPDSSPGGNENKGNISESSPDLSVLTSRDPEIDHPKQNEYMSQIGDDPVKFVADIVHSTESGQEYDDLERTNAAVEQKQNSSLQ